MMSQEPTKLAEEMLYLPSVIAECLVLVELCQDCLDHDVADRDSKLRVLLDSLEGHIWHLNDDFPYRLKALHRSLDPLEASSRIDAAGNHCT